MPACSRPAPVPIARAGVEAGYGMAPESQRSVTALSFGLHHTHRPMTSHLRHTLLSVRDLLATAGPFIVLALALLAVAYWALDPAPPTRVVLATGSELGAYAEFGKR